MICSKKGIFFNVTLEHPTHTHLAGAPGGGGRFTATDDAGFDAVPGEPAQGNAVLGIEALGFSQHPIRTGQKIKMSIGEHAVDIHQQDFDAGKRVREAAPRSAVD